MTHRTRMPSTPLMVPDYDANHPSGFFHILSRKKFIGFCCDIEDCNRLLLISRDISRQEIEELFTSTVTALHRVWCADRKKGGGLPKRRRHKYLVKAINLMRRPEAEAYWAEKAKEAETARKQQQLIVESQGNVAVGYLVEMLEGQKLNGGEQTS